MCDYAYDTSTDSGSRVEFKFEDYDLAFIPEPQSPPLEPVNQLIVSHIHLQEPEHCQELKQQLGHEEQQHQSRQLGRKLLQRRARPRKSPESLLAQCQVCCVCGDPASGFHYSALTCEACKSFFKRTVHDKHKYTCFGNFDCSVSKSQRKACQYCRFQKCLKSGMQPQEVRMDHKRGGRRKCKRTSREQFDQLVDRISYPVETEEAPSAKPPMAVSAGLSAGPGGQDRLLRDFVREVESAHAGGCAPIELPMPDWLAAEVKTPAAFRLAVRHWFRRGLAGVVHWSRSLTCLTALPRSDLCELLHENWLAVLALDTLAWSQPFDGTIRFGRNFCLRQMDLESYQPLDDFYCTLQNMFWSLDGLQLNSSELAVLKLVALLDQSVADRLIDSHAIGPLSGAAMRALYTVCAEKLGTDPGSGLVDDYIGKLLMRLGFTVNLRHGCRIWTSLDPPSCSEARELIDAALGARCSDGEAVWQHCQQIYQHHQLQLHRQEGSSASFCLSPSSSSASLLL